MKTVRASVFETNSSSTHAIAYTKKPKIRTSWPDRYFSGVKKNMKSGAEACALHVPPIRYGRSYTTRLKTFMEKLSWLVVGSMDNYTRLVDEGRWAFNNYLKENIEKYARSHDLGVIRAAVNSVLGRAGLLDKDEEATKFYKNMFPGRRNEQMYKYLSLDILGAFVFYESSGIYTTGTDFDIGDPFLELTSKNSILEILDDPTIIIEITQG
jgi:hypothetical protein